MGWWGQAFVLGALAAACSSESVNDNPNNSSGGSGGSTGGSGGSAGSATGGSSAMGGSGAVGGSTGGFAGVGVGGTAGAGAVGGSDSGTGGVAGDGGVELSDEFNGGFLEGKWMIHNANLVTVGVSLNQLEMIPSQSIWYNNSEGPLVYQEVTGNFRASTYVSVFALSGSGPPTQPVHWAGLMARNPLTPAPPNTVHIVIGKDSQNTSGISQEWANTTNGSTAFSNAPWSDTSNFAEVRICRVGPYFHLLRRPDSTSPWTTYVTLTRNDMPNVVQVGPVAHANTGTPGLTARFDYVHFAPVSGVGECTLDD